MSQSATSTRDIDFLTRANFFAQSADQLALTAIPLIAVLSLRLDAGGGGLINVSLTLPYFLLSILLGVLVDTVSKKHVLITTEFIRSLALLTIFGLIFVDRIELWSLMILSFVAAFGSVGFNTTLPAWLPSLVEKDRLTFYNGRLELMRAMSLMLGPAFAGSLVAWLGASTVFISAVILTGLTILSVGNMTKTGPGDALGPNERGLLKNIGAGMRFIIENKGLATIMLVAFFWNCGWFVLQAAFMPVAIDSWGLSAQSVGYALACMGFGLLVGSLFSQQIINAMGFAASLAFGPVISVLASIIVLVNVRCETAILPAVAFFLFGFSSVIWVITTNTLRQVMTPKRLIGRVSVMYLTANWGARPFGAMLGAIIGARYGGGACVWLPLQRSFSSKCCWFSSPDCPASHTEHAIEHCSGPLQAEATIMKHLFPIT